MDGFGIESVTIRIYKINVVDTKSNPIQSRQAKPTQIESK